MVTQADVDTLEAVMKSGVLTVKYNDRLVTYQSLSEMAAELARMKRELANSSGGGGGRTYRVAAFRKGFGR